MSSSWVVPTHVSQIYNYKDTLTSNSKLTNSMKTSSHISLAAKAIACALFATIASTPAAFAGSAAPLISEKAMEWRTDLDAALADAASTNQTVLLRFTATWCAPCRVMDIRVWPDPTVQAELAEDHIIVKSDIDEESSQLLARKYGVRGVPTLLLLDSAGKEISRAGFMSSPETVKFLMTTGSKKDQR